MENFKIDKTDKGLYRFIFSFPFSNNPVILFGYEQTDRESCNNQINMLFKNLLTPGFVSFISNRQGYRFLIFSVTGIPIGFSCFFATQKKMKDSLENVKVYIRKKVEENKISEKKSFNPYLMRF